MFYLLLAGIVAWGLPTIYSAYRFREYRKFLAGAFFVSWGIQVYLYLANVSVPLLGTSLVFTPEISAVVIPASAFVRSGWAVPGPISSNTVARSVGVWSRGTAHVAPVA